MVHKFIAGLIALIFLTGTMTMSGAYAATQGQPFQELDKRITALEQDNVQSDSFFDVFTELGLSPANFFNVFDILQRAIGDPDFDLLRNGDPDFDTLDARIAALEANVVDCDARGPGVDLHGCDLSDAELHNQDFTGANFRGANLAAANFFNSILREADFTGANLIGAQLTHVDLTDATLRGTDLSVADVSSSNLSSVDFNFANPGPFFGDAFGGSYANPPCIGIFVCISLPLTP